jgi:hypothetical protein
MKRTYTAEVEIESTRTEYVRRWVQADSLEEAREKLLSGYYTEEISHEEVTDSGSRITTPIVETGERP